MGDLASVRTGLEAIGQDHVLRFFDELPEAQRAALLGQIEELNALTMRATRRTRRTAVNSRRADGEYKSAIEARIFRDHRLP